MCQIHKNIISNPVHFTTPAYTITVFSNALTIKLKAHKTRSAQKETKVITELA